MTTPGRLVLDSSAVSAFAEATGITTARIRGLRAEGLWPPTVPSVVLVECLTGHVGRDAATNRLLKGCDLVESLPGPLARRAATLRTRGRRGSAVDAVVVASAEPGGVVAGGDLGDLRALAAHARDVRVQRF